MANRDMTNQQYSFEKARKTVNCHLYFGSSGAVTLDAQGSKGVVAATKVSTPSQNGTYTLSFGVSVNSITQRDAYVKLLGLSSTFETEYSGSAAPAASAVPAVWRDDLRNGLPLFGDVAPGTVTQTAASGGGFTAGAYKWIVTAVDSLGNETQLSTAVANEVSNASVTSNQKVTIGWVALTQTGVIGYCVYRTAASGGTGAENVFVGFASGASAVSLVDLGTAATPVYQGGSATLARGGKKLSNYLLPAYSNAIPPFGYNAITVAFYVATTLTNPAAGEAVRLQFSFGDSDAA